MGFFSDLFSGNFSAAEADITSALAKLPVEIQTYISKVESDEYQEVIIPAAILFRNDIVAGGFTTASFVKAGKDVVALAATKGVTILISDALAVLNNLISPLQTASDEAPKADAPTEPAEDSVPSTNS